MLNTKKTALALALTGTLAGATGSAHAAAVASMNITGGCFEMPGVTTFCIEYGGDNFIGGNSTVTAFGPDTNLVGGYIGNGGGGIPSTDQDPDSIVAVNFFGNPVNTYTAAMNLGDDVTPAGTQMGGPVPTGDVTAGGDLTMDMSSFFANWNGTDFNQGGIATGTWTDTGTIGDNIGTYSMTWSSLIVGGSFDGKTGFWTTTGDMTLVPVPAAVWLMGSGLIGLVGVARRRKARA